MFLTLVYTLSEVRSVTERLKLKHPKNFDLFYYNL